ncbi:drug resistance transporter, EmrB/QacA subfamily [Parafrankia irregularis]|uniref:Drug resistance transporter, EmrB/QacA subfamily n=1 Tax=Parafrankia irregularis TaxID=795642 RepID=A0A0S4QIY0_9ACTN|nr:MULTISPECIES: MFS transporter [Parafrankia]MBE3205590.1 MFS transporter [Parafrankia sp. CH37]CUU55511.1 drug resistance transporter, EmrB/QacA subfamily [Parafrankia irregularis]
MSLTGTEAGVAAQAPPRADGGSASLNDKRWWVLCVLGLAQLMVVLDGTVVNIALPSAQQALDFSNDQRQWIVTGYALAFGSLLLLGGRLADLYGRKRMFLLGLIGFAVASAVGGAATSFAMLVAARVVQGAFGALLAPAALALLSTTFTDVKERSKAFGIYGAIAGGGAAIGLLLGGVLTEYLSWRWCMYVNLFFAAVAFVGGALWLRHEMEQERPRIDIPGIVLVSTGLFALVYGFSRAETDGWSDPVTIGCLAAAAVLLIAFVVVQQRVAQPVLPLRVVLDRYRGGSLVAMLMSGAGMFGVFLFLTYYLQQNLGFSAVKSGLAFLPMTAALMISAQFGSAVLTQRVGPRYIIAPGLAIAGVGLWMLTSIDLGSTYLGSVLPPTMIFGAGIGAVFASAMSLSTAGVEAKDAGAASAMVNTVQQVGGSVGTALLSTMAATAADNYVDSHAPGPMLPVLASLESYTTVFWWSAGIMILAAVITAVVLPGQVRQPGENEEEVVAIGG